MCNTWRNTLCHTYLQKQLVMLRDALVEQRDVGQAEAGAQRHLKHAHMRDPSFPVGRLLCLIAQKRRKKRNAAHAQSTGWSVLGRLEKLSPLEGCNPSQSQTRLPVQGKRERL
jgi:hypothetical protein